MIWRVIKIEIYGEERKLTQRNRHIENINLEQR